nr:MAG TPA: hypothetical protein [Caudoviricetes sp.]
MAFIYNNNTIRPATPQEYVPGDALINMMRVAKAQYPESLKVFPQVRSAMIRLFNDLYPIYRNMWIYRYLANPANGWMNVTEALVLKRVKKPSEYHVTTTVPSDNIGKANTDFWTKFNAFLTWAAHKHASISTVFDNYIKYRRQFIIENDMRRYEEGRDPEDYRILLNRLSVDVDQLNPDPSKPLTVDLIKDQRWRTLQLTWNRIVFSLVHMTTVALPEDERRSLMTNIHQFFNLCEYYMVGYNQPVFPVVNIYQKTSIRNRPLDALEAAQYIDNNFRLRMLNLVMNFSPTGFHDVLFNTHNINGLTDNGFIFNANFSGSTYNHMFDVFINDRPFINHLTTNIKEDNLYKQAVNAFAQEIRKNGTIKNTSFDTYFNATISTWFSKLRYGIPIDVRSSQPIHDDGLRLKQLYVDARTSGGRFNNGYKPDSVDFRAALNRAAYAKPDKGTLVTEASLQKWLDRIFIETIKAIPTNNIKGDTEYFFGNEEKVYRSGSLYQNLIYLMGSEEKILELL